MNATVSFDAITSSTAVNHLDFASIITAASNSVSVGTDYANNTVSVISYNGTLMGTYAVNGSGTATITNAAANSPLLVGYAYTGQIKTMPIEAGAQFGVAQGSARRGHEISVFIDRSRGGKYYQSQSSNQYPLDTEGTASVLKTGEVRLSLNASPNDNQTVITQDAPYPLTILWMVTKGYTYDT
jgi:hypothetical protein